MCARVLRPWLPYPERAANWWVSERLTRNLSFVARMSSPLSFVRALRQEYCRAQRRLNAPCALVLKLFDVHLTIAEQRRNDNARGRAQSASSMGRIKQQWFADLEPAAHPRRPPLRVCNDQGLCWEV